MASTFFVSLRSHKRKEADSVNEDMKIEIIKVLEHFGGPDVPSLVGIQTFWPCNNLILLTVVVLGERTTSLPFVAYSMTEGGNKAML